MNHLDSLRRIVLLLALLTAATVAGSVPAQAQKQTTLSINSYAKQVDLFGKHHPRRAFANVGKATDEWREFKTAARLNNDPNAPFAETALVWLKAKKVVAANFTFTSESGDWAQYVTYYFREDGKLAKIHASLNTFQGNLSVIRDKFYDTDGKLLSDSTRYLDLATRKPAKSRDFADQPIPVYLNAQDLPFFKLL